MGSNLDFKTIIKIKTLISLKRGSKMTDLFLILTGLFILMANIIGFIIYKKNKNLYYAALSIFLLAIVFCAIGGALAVFIVRDPFAMFYGTQLGKYLIVNSAIVLIIAMLTTIVIRFRTNN